MARIFLCHASEDKPQVREVHDRLRALGFETWLDKDKLLPGQDWHYEIEKALEAADFVIVFLSSRSVGKRGYVQREFRRVLEHSEEMPLGQIHTIPVKLDDCEAPREFRRYEWANLHEEGEFDRIVEALHLGLEQRGLPKPTPVEPERFTNSIGMTFVRIPAGKFLMGSPESDPLTCDTEKPQHQVLISQPFYLGIHPVTQAQWEAVIGTNPSRFKGVPERPVETVSWSDVEYFLQRLNACGDGHTYTLPTAAQWEYACRAGSTSAYCFGDDETQLGDYAWYKANAGGTTHPVGQKQPNAWGLYDMHGNVWEWCQDISRTYRFNTIGNPLGALVDAIVGKRGVDALPGTIPDDFRVIRGGDWGDPARRVRTALRVAYDPGTRAPDIGFRCLSLDREPSGGA